MEIENIINDIISTARDLIRIPSRNPPGEELECSIYIARRLREEGLEVKVIHEPFKDRPQIIAYTKNPIIMLNGHIDTVPEGNRELWSVDPFSGTIKDGKLYGRGAVDMKSSLAIMVHLPRIIKEGLVLTFAVGEERAEGGTKALLKYIDNVRYGIVLEPTSLAIAPYQRGAAWFKIIVKGRSTHASLPEYGINSILLAKDIIDKIDRYNESISSRRFYNVNPTCTVTMINGGIKENIIPDRCEITIDRRLIPAESLAGVINEMRELLGGVEIELLAHRDSVVIKDSSYLVKVLSSSLKEVVGYSTITCFPASTDNEHIVEKGIESIVWGPGDLKLAHSIDEYINIKDIEVASKVLELALYRLLSQEDL